jgi:release factor glutamine methyltransferase
MPFLDLRIGLESRPLIPRPETEWWTEALIEHLKERFGEEPFSFLDLCAGSGAIGLAVLAAFPNAKVSFAEIVPAHAAQIRKNIEANELDAGRADVRESDLFSRYTLDDLFDVIATNPPYVPAERVLEKEVTSHEPARALFAGPDGLSYIRQIAGGASAYLRPKAELWMECDITNINQAAQLLLEADSGAMRTEIRTDPYSRPRIVVGYYA